MPPMEDPAAVVAGTMAAAADSTVAADFMGVDFMGVDSMVADSMHFMAAGDTGLPPGRVACVHFRGQLAAMRAPNQIDPPPSIPEKVSAQQTWATGRTPSPPCGLRWPPLRSTDRCTMRTRCTIQPLARELPR